MSTAAAADLHIVFIPFFTSSHIIPLVHVARLFASRGVRSTIICTVHHARLFQASVDRDIAAGHHITVHTLDFPATEVGLPVGIEDLSVAPTREMSVAVYRGMVMLQNPMEHVIRQLAPDCIFSDSFFPWTVELADELKIPRLLFYPTCFFYHSVAHSLRVYKPHENVKSDSESFLVPNLPGEIMMKRSQLPGHFKGNSLMAEILNPIYESEKRSYGLVHNTFYEIEPAYVDHFKKVKDTKIWHIGPLFKFFDGEIRKDRVPDRHHCLSWLDEQNPKSVIYACFGSMVKFQEDQITEIALALEESKGSFIWVVGKTGSEGIGGLPEGFEERIKTKNKGLIMTEWVPQVEILKHPAVGGFWTHCGWNSLLEAVGAGVPLMTWPLYAEQFYNEKLVELLGIGVGVGSEVWNIGFNITSPVIRKDSFVKAIEVLTSESVVAESIRRNSKELAIRSENAVKEGGSSTTNLISLIEELKAVKFGPKD